MGQKVSSLRLNKNCTSSCEKVRPSIFEDHSFFWMDGLRGHNILLPSSWEEFQAWIEHAEQTSSELGLGNCEVKITPSVLPHCGDEIDRIPFMSWAERADFYSELVSILVYTTTSTGETSSQSLSASEFFKCYKLCKDLSDLRAMKKSRNPTEDDALEQQEVAKCSICCHKRQFVVLQCNHSICVVCEQRWVQTRMCCPFCRKRFSNLKGARQYRLPECMQTKVEQDIEKIESQLRSLWKNEVTPSLESTPEVVKLDDSY